MRMGKNDPRVSMSKSVKGKPPRGVGSRNPLKSAAPGEHCPPEDRGSRRTRAVGARDDSDRSSFNQWAPTK